MKTAFNLSLTLFLSLILFSASAQKFAVPLEGFSNKKTTYLYMEGGKEMKGNLYGTGFKRAKGLVEAVKMKDGSDNKMKIDPAKIEYMYVPASALGKLGAATETMGNIANWEKSTNYASDYDTTLLEDGYVYFEKSKTKLNKKKTETLMLQLLNAPFSNKFKVYHDPFAKETMSAGVGGIALVGGLDKSYYIKKEDEDAAWRLFKKDYKEKFAEMFGDKPEFVNKYKGNINWSDLEKHLYEYSQL
jgi:hypothetical protein